MMRRPRVLCFVISGHGYGHASRQMEVVRVAMERDPEARVVVLTAVPESIFRNYLGDAAFGERLAIVPYRADVGLVQIDSLTMDRAATLVALEARFGDDRQAAQAEIELADRLAPYRPSVIVADIPPVAFAAAARLKVPSVGASNFDWAWVYGHYAREEPGFARWEQLFRRWQGQATLALHMDPGPPRVGFSRVIEVEPLARRQLDAPEEVRRALAIPAGHKAVLVSFGGCGLEDANRRIPPIPGVIWLLAPPMPDLGRADVRFVPEVPYLTLFAVADAVFIKPGYGTVCEAAYHRSRILYTDRGDFPEYAWLLRWMDANVPSLHVPSGELGTEAGARAIATGLKELFALPERWPSRMGGAEQIAAILEEIAGTTP
ncbi:MAG: hypothetical protein ABI193_22660 [Minicystis sp.]